jgi:heme/copper-type cytochrome/quinol oxidase subunit 2
VPEKPPYKPTRMCPHRWCKPLHLALTPFALAVIAFDLWHNWLWLLSFAVCGTVGHWVTKAIHFRRRRTHGTTSPSVKDVVADLKESPTPLDLEMEDAMYEGTGWRTLEVRRGWATAAVTMDVFWVLLVGLVCTSMFADYATQALRSSQGPLAHGSVSVVGFLTGVSLMGFTVYAHKKATQPRKPKRAWVPAFLRTNA